MPLYKVRCTGSRNIVHNKGRLLPRTDVSVQDKDTLGASGFDEEQGHVYTTDFCVHIFHSIAYMYKHNAFQFV